MIDIFRIQEFVNTLWNPLLNFESQGSVVQRLDATHYLRYWINLYPLNNTMALVERIHWINNPVPAIYLLHHFSKPIH